MNWKQFHLKEVVAFSSISLKSSPAGEIPRPERVLPTGVRKEVVLCRIPHLVQVIHVEQVAGGGGVQDIDVAAIALL